jgi:hypothetical protein
LSTFRLYTAPILLRYRIVSITPGSTSSLYFTTTLRFRKHSIAMRRLSSLYSFPISSSRKARTLTVALTEIGYSYLTLVLLKRQTGMPPLTHLGQYLYPKLPSPLILPEVLTRMSIYYARNPSPSSRSSISARVSLRD